ncbi:TPA: hypothetical protein JI095_00525 [Acinetobacter baumannii]|nr:hypothetical protein [Acinetobacter baumannii]
MDNYKIKVKDEAESKEAQELFFELGYRWNHNGKTYFKVSSGEILAYSRGVLFQCGDDTGSEITLPQLRDLVVLKRNDINDANCIDKKREAWYLASDGTYYAWQYRKLCWDTESDACVEAHDIKPIKKHLETATGCFDENGEHHLTFSNGTEEKDPALISGDVALANVHKHIVQYLHDDEPYGRWTTITDNLWSQYHLGMFLDPDTKFKFRFKPQTIKLNGVEVPAPDTDKMTEDDICWHITGAYECGYANHKFDPDHPYILGVWSTEEKIKQVVAALRSVLRGTNS